MNSLRKKSFPYIVLRSFRDLYGVSYYFLKMSFLACSQSPVFISPLSMSCTRPFTFSCCH